jgi:hypothetical protein
MPPQLHHGLGHDPDNKNVVASALAIIAIYKGQQTLGRIAMLTEDERCEMLRTFG